MATRFQKIPVWVLKILKYPPRVLYALGFGPLIGGLVMLLVTRGCKTGKLRTTPLQYEIIDGDIYIGSMRGKSAAWYRNLLVDPKVKVRLGRLRSRALAEPLYDVGRTIEFLQERQRRQPLMIKTMLKADGVKNFQNLAALESYAKNIALVKIKLIED